MWHFQAPDLEIDTQNEEFSASGEDKRIRIPNEHLGQIGRRFDFRTGDALSNTLVISSYPKKVVYSDVIFNYRRDLQVEEALSYVIRENFIESIFSRFIKLLSHFNWKPNSYQLKLLVLTLDRLLKAENREVFESTSIEMNHDQEVTLVRSVRSGVRYIIVGSDPDDISYFWAEAGKGDIVHLKDGQSVDDFLDRYMPEFSS